MLTYGSWRYQVWLSFVNQAVPDIRYKLRKIDRLAEKSIQKLLTVAQKVYTNWETLEDKQMRVIAADNTKHTWNMAWTLLVFTAGNPEEKKQ